jgi:hypothetical protein
MKRKLSRNMDLTSGIQTETRSASQGYRGDSHPTHMTKCEGTCWLPMNYQLDMRGLPTRIANVLQNYNIKTILELLEAMGPEGILGGIKARNFGQASYSYLCRWLGIPEVERPLGKIPPCEQKTRRGFCQREAAIWIPEFRRRLCSLHAKRLLDKYPHLESEIYCQSRQKKLERLELRKQRICREVAGRVKAEGERALRVRPSRRA